MTLDEFEQQFRASLATTLDHLQAISLLANQIEIQKVEAGEALQNLTQLVEDFLTQERERNTSS
ncbi:MAG: hypothetical protein IGS48_21535 [Oscillatoriales cyanobacterium C42_A2020_001]|nr:hypothetical protein [Leptolyngbyaceae cyanobacterium C42_A2020_001]